MATDADDTRPAIDRDRPVGSHQGALREGRIDDAVEHAAEMHGLSQDDAALHAYGHWLSARVQLARGYRVSALRHMYLTVMAPYGTLRRRLRAA